MLMHDYLAGNAAVTGHRPTPDEFKLVATKLLQVLSPCCEPDEKCKLMLLYCLSFSSRDLGVT